MSIQEMELDETPGETVVEAGVESPAPKKGKREPKGMNSHGFRNGSDSAMIVDLMVAGGLDRQDINDKVGATIDPNTRSGRQKNIPSLISGLLARLEERGYRIESSWRLVPPSDQ